MFESIFLRLPEFSHTVTIRHLVHHISGIRDWTSTLPLAGWSFDDEVSFEQILRSAYEQKALNFQPGAEYSYSNTGYNLLARIVEVVSEKTFANWTREYIFKPLNMSQSLFLDHPMAVIPKRATGYYQIGTFWQNKPNLLTALGSSSMYSTTTDLANWMKNLAQPKVGGTSVVERMFNQGTLNDGEEIAYAYGLSVTEYRGTRRVAHSGSWAMFRTYVCYFPEYDLSIIVLNQLPQ